MPTTDTAPKPGPGITGTGTPPEKPEGGDIEKNQQRAAVESAARGDDLDSQERMDATEWFLSPDPEEDINTRSFKLRVGKKGSRREYITWTVQAMGRERIQEIRESHRRQSGRRRRMSGEVETDDAAANLQIAYEGTLDPDFSDPKLRGEFVDPADAMRARFSFKPGLIDQIAAEVIAVSGYDDDDVVEVEAVKGS